MHAPFKRQVERKVRPGEGLFSLRLPKFESYQPGMLNSPAVILRQPTCAQHQAKSLPQLHVGNAAAPTRTVSAAPFPAKSAEIPPQHRRTSIPSDSAVRVRPPQPASAVSGPSFPGMEERPILSSVRRKIDSLQLETTRRGRPTGAPERGSPLAFFQFPFPRPRRPVRHWSETGSKARLRFARARRGARPRAEDEAPLRVGDRDSAATRPRDVWCLGRHRPICGDARDRIGKLEGFPDRAFLDQGGGASRQSIGMGAPHWG